MYISLRYQITKPFSHILSLKSGFKSFYRKRLFIQTVLFHFEIIHRNLIYLFIWLPAASVVRQGDENVSEVSDGRVMPHGDNPFMVHVFNLRRTEDQA